jgi:hypothetical protein
MEGRAPASFLIGSLEFSAVLYTRKSFMQDMTRSPLRREFLSIVEVIAVLILCLVLTCQMETRKEKRGARVFVSSSLNLRLLLAAVEANRNHQKYVQDVLIQV